MKIESFKWLFPSSCVAIIFLITTCQASTKSGQNYCKSPVNYINPYRNLVFQRKSNSSSTSSLQICGQNSLECCITCLVNCTGNCCTPSESENLDCDITNHLKRSYIYVDLPLKKSCRKVLCCMSNCCFEGEQGQSCSCLDRESNAECKSSPCSGNCDIDLKLVNFELKELPSCTDTEQCLKAKCLNCEEDQEDGKCQFCFNFNLTNSGRLNDNGNFDLRGVFWKDQHLLLNQKEFLDLHNSTHPIKFWNFLMFNKNNDLAFRRANYARMKSLRKRPFEYKMVKIQRKEEDVVDKKKRDFDNRELYLRLTVENDTRNSSVPAVNYLKDSFTSEETIPSGKAANYVYDYDWKDWKNSKRENNLRDMELKIRTFVRASLGNKDCYNAFTEDHLEENEKEYQEQEDDLDEEPEQLESQRKCHLNKQEITGAEEENIVNLIKELEELEDEKTEDGEDTEDEEKQNDSEFEKALKEIFVKELKKLVIEKTAKEE